MVNRYFKYRLQNCKKCGVGYQPVSGKQLYCSRICNRQVHWIEILGSEEYNQKRREYDGRKRQRRTRWLRKYKCAKGCELCGYNKHHAALDWDHRNPNNKTFTIGSGIRNNLKELFNEIRKCRILCANCHRIHTSDNKQYRRKKI